MLEMSVSDPAAPAPGIVEVRVAGKELPSMRVDSLPQLPGWPKDVTSGIFAPSRGITLADFDGDGRQEVIMPIHNKVYCWRYDGTDYPGWPAAVTADSCQYAASVADIDRDGDFEVAVSTRGLLSGGAVYVIEENGQVKTGWPFRGANGNFDDAPTLADVNGDETLEVIVGERGSSSGFVHVLNCRGVDLPGWPYTIDHVPAMGAAVGDINLDGLPEIVYGSYNSVYVFHPNGTVLPGWPRQVANANISYQSPCLADIDFDDTLEIVTAMHKDAAGCYVWRHDGTPQPGWPRLLGGWTYCPPSVCDLYRDGDRKVICGRAGGGIVLPVLYAWDAVGGLLSGFPHSMLGGAECNMTVADIDGDGDMEIMFTSNMMTSNDSLGYLYAVHHDGAPVDGWPLRPFGFTYLNGATVADIDGDDSLDIVGVSAYAARVQVSIWEAGVPFSRASWEFPTYQFDMQRTGLYRAYVSGVAERETPARVATRPGGIVRGLLQMGLQPSAGGSRLRIDLVDAAGRKVLDLHPGPNDVSRLAPGVYFVAGAGSGQDVIRVVVAR
jgi:hypothetical protein